MRDYQVYSSREGTHVKGGSAFNIKAESLRLGDFSEGEVRQLLAQHTAERGQRFEDGTTEHIGEFTCGQPWLVNALAYQACFKTEGGRDRSEPIRVVAIDEAREALILGRVTHLDQLANTLREERVRRVILPMLAGSADWGYSVRDLEYVRDLGLAATEGAVRIANPIYAEVVPRELTAVLQSGLEAQVDPAWYANADGSLDVAGLLSAFQSYFREHAESWVERYGHAEAGPQLVLHAYLQRVVNSGTGSGASTRWAEGAATCRSNGARSSRTAKCASANASSSARCARRRLAWIAWSARAWNRRPHTWTGLGRNPGT